MSKNRLFDVYFNNPWIMLIIFQHYYTKVRATSRLYWHDCDYHESAHGAHKLPNYFLYFR